MEQWEKFMKEDSVVFNELLESIRNEEEMMEMAIQDRFEEEMAWK